VKPVQSPRPVISLPVESPEVIELAARFAGVLALHGTSRAKAAEGISQARAATAAAGRNPGLWINRNLLAGETGEQVRQHLRDLEQSIRRLQEFRPGGERAAVRSIREDRFADVSLAGTWREDDVLYLGRTVASRAARTLVGSPATIADAVLAYHDLRQETLRLIKQAVAGRGTGARRAA
jgi:alkanesulfonate monooxygenase SsuD/methylene tetrahydromethanopterin reductase-like flavin-dependent oxidoreductase (luciferase family)